MPSKPKKKTTKQIKSEAKATMKYKAFLAERFAANNTESE